MLWAVLLHDYMWLKRESPREIALRCRRPRASVSALLRSLTKRAICSPSCISEMAEIYNYWLASNTTLESKSAPGLSHSSSPKFCA
jgi:hypothetical protein